MDVKIGDSVEVICNDCANHLPNQKKRVVGIVVQVFDALTADFETGINLEIDIYGPNRQ